MKKRATRASSSQHWEGGKFNFLQLRFNFLFTDTFIHLSRSWEVEIHILFSCLDMPTIFFKRCEGFIHMEVYMFDDV